MMLAKKKKKVMNLILFSFIYIYFKIIFTRDAEQTDSI